MKELLGGVCAPKGFIAAGGQFLSVQDQKEMGLTLVYSEKICTVAAVYTQNKVKGAPIAVTKKNIANGQAQAILCNSGNANTCAPNGEQLAQECCALAGASLGLKASDVVVASTGVIGQELFFSFFKENIPHLVTQLSVTANTDAAKSIMTTDTKPKELAVSFEIDGKVCHIGAMGKGSGMINPNMATMLIFITSDVAISSSLLQKALSDCNTQTFNQIYIDGDTSTNDMACILANGMADNTYINAEEQEGYGIFCKALTALCTKMSRCIAGDGEGATKLLSIEVSHAKTATVARKIAKTVASSDLFKAAMFGKDANWGRILCAIGYTDADFSIENVSVVLKSKAGEIKVCENTKYYPFSEEKASIILQEDEIEVEIDMHDGTEKGSAWGCDLTYDYVRINGEYRS